MYINYNNWKILDFCSTLMNLLTTIRMCPGRPIYTDRGRDTETFLH